MTEIAWNANRKWVGNGPPRGPMPWPVVRCQCQTERPVCGVFLCSSCKRYMPWCYGGIGALCDACENGAEGTR